MENPKIKAVLLHLNIDLLLYLTCGSWSRINIYLILNISENTKQFDEVLVKDETTQVPQVL